MSNLIIRNATIPQDSDGYYSLTEMWRAAGSDEGKTPTKWRSYLYVKELSGALAENPLSKGVIAKTRSKSAVYSKTGRGGGTFAYYILAVAFAEYLNPDIGIEVRDIATRVWGGDISVLDEFNRRKLQQIEEDELRVHNREEMAARNKDLAKEGKKAGIKEGWQYAELHNAGYRGMYDGKDEDAIHEHKKLKKGEKILNFMTGPEGAANVFRVTQAQVRMARERPRSPQEAYQMAKEAGELTRKAMGEIGGVIPEDMPVPDSIADAKKRLAAARKALPR
jgi:hypothetical protein